MSLGGLRFRFPSIGPFRIALYCVVLTFTPTLTTHSSYAFNTIKLENIKRRMITLVAYQARGTSLELNLNRIPNLKIVKSLSLMVLQCTFRMYWARVYNISQWWSLCKKEMAAPPGQFIALQAINALKETISE